MATPWDPQPSPPAPAWKADVSAVLDKLAKIDSISQSRVVDLLPILKLQQLYSQGPTGFLPEAAARLGELSGQLRSELQIQGESKVYRNTVNNWALNAPFFDAHPQVAIPFPPMPPDLLMYLKAIEGLS